MIIVMTLASFPFLYYMLELPKYIVNDAIDGKSFPKDFFGVQLGQIEYLLVLCSLLFLLLVVNALFSMKINTYQGISAERMLRRLRYQLFDRILRFPPRHFQRVTPSELSSMITSEVEPLGDFIRDSFAMPMVQGGTMVTVLYFMISEDPILGFVAIAMVPVQAWIIPKLQHKVNMLGRERVFRARQLAGRVGESVLGIGDVHANDTSRFLRADISHRLAGIFWVRAELFNRKFFMKALNAFLSQLTPLFFYSVGGYLIIEGDLSLGALVAVLAAYNRFTTPWKELLKYYQRLNDAKIKYEQLIEQFQPSEMMDPSLQGGDIGAPPKLDGKISLKGVSVIEEGAKLLDNVTLDIDARTRLAIVCDPVARDKLAHSMARLLPINAGTISVGDIKISSLPETVTGSAIGYTGPESYVFDGTIEDNLLFGLKHSPTLEKEDDREPKEISEASAAGNTTDYIFADWVDHTSLGCTDKDQLQNWLLKVIQTVELDGPLKSRALGMGMDPNAQLTLAEDLVKARSLISTRLHGTAENAELTYPFKFDQYNANASVAANLVFGEPTDEEYQFNTLGQNEDILALLDKCELREVFIEKGLNLSKQVIELFGDLTHGDPMFDQFSFVDEDTLTDLKALTTAVEADGPDILTDEDRAMLISMTFQLIVDKHRLGLIDDDFQAKIIGARVAFRDSLTDEKREKFAFFDQESFNGQLSNRCNLIMGRINHRVNNAEQRVNEITFEVLDELGLTERMTLYATRDAAGVGGSRWSQADRQKIVLARSVLKRPDILILNDALSALNRESQTRIRSKVFDLLPDTTIVSISSEAPDAKGFDAVLNYHNGVFENQADTHVASLEELGATDQAGAEDEVEELSGTVDEEALALARVPIFAGIKPQSLKLLAFSSRRVQFRPGEKLINMGDQGSNAYVILAGKVHIVVGNDDTDILATKSVNELLGELSLLSNTTATANVIAAENVTALEIQKEAFLQLMENDQHMASQVAKVVSDKLVSTIETMSEKS